MYPNNPNFALISKAISVSLDTLKKDLNSSDTALQELEEARAELFQALSNTGIAHI
ncbi:MAG: hypothetical protein AB2392_01890 [Neobacillus sp.]|jgi:hypothetical protein